MDQFYGTAYNKLLKFHLLFIFTPWNVNSRRLKSWDYIVMHIFVSTFRRASLHVPQIISRASSQRDVSPILLILQETEKL
jgi:hypothetical protein